MRRTLSILLVLGLILGLSACANPFAREFYSAELYPPTEQNRPQNGGKLNVGSYEELKETIRLMVYSSISYGTIVFSTDYEGDSADDMQNACWQIRAEDALCTYCVTNINYEISHIVNHDEAELHIRYSVYATPAEEVVQLSYIVGVENLLLTALENNDSRVTLLIQASTYSSDDMARLVKSVYRSHPASTAAEPKVDVYMYSGSDLQRLYEIDLSYPLSEVEIAARKAQLSSLDIRKLVRVDESDHAQTALALCEYLLFNCSYSSDSDKNTVYDALILGKANSEGLSLAYVELCRQMGIECVIVYGQRSTFDRCWNIIQLDGNYYHVDILACLQSGPSVGFLRTDEGLWPTYRWDASSYPACHGTLRYRDLLEDERVGWVVQPSPTPPPSEPPVESDPPQETEEPVDPTPTPPPSEPPIETEPPHETDPPIETEKPVETDPPQESERPDELGQESFPPSLLERFLSFFRSAGRVKEP